jgi:hypothetical protein
MSAIRGYLWVMIPERGVEMDPQPPVFVSHGVVSTDQYAPMY